MFVQDAFQKFRRIVNGKAKVLDFAFFFVFRKNFKNMVRRNDVVIKTAVQIVDKVIIKIIYAAVLQLLCKNTFNIFFTFNCPGGSLVASVKLSRVWRYTSALRVNSSLLPL